MGVLSRSHDLFRHRARRPSARHTMRAAAGPPGPGLEVVLTSPPDASVHRFNLLGTHYQTADLPHDAARFDTSCG